MCSYLRRLSFKSAFLCVQGTVCEANAVLSVDKISTVLSMATLTAKFIGEYKERRAQEERRMLYFC